MTIILILAAKESNDFKENLMCSICVKILILQPESRIKYAFSNKSEQKPFKTLECFKVYDFLQKINCNPAKLQNYVLAINFNG